jgi:phosphatidylethanolamine/phosphatidyl-N-methylethanolamine N-methyltransferase
MFAQLQRATLRSMITNDVLSFFRSWTRDPLQVGAIVPSGEVLAEVISSEIRAGCGPVIELGPGTGVFTRALLARGVKECDLTLVESNTDFVPLLQARFPEARVLSMDAARLNPLDLRANEKVAAVISGLPLLAMSPRKVFAILAAAFGCLRSGGALYQFTYGLSCPVRRPYLDRLGLKAARVGRAIRNVPPATVYRISRRTLSKHVRA